MTKTILITGATDGIGLETARSLATLGHNLLLHGRNPAKLQETAQAVGALNDSIIVEQYTADLSKLPEVLALADAVTTKHRFLNVLINNAGVLKTAGDTMADGYDIRFVVNTFAPILLARRLIPTLGTGGRILNLSSAAQASVEPDVMCGKESVDDMGAYAQSKLALTMWSRHAARSLKDGPAIFAINPGSLLATKMVKDGFGIAGNDIAIGAQILVRAALDDDFTSHSGEYFDNDSGQFAPPHADALDDAKCNAVVSDIEAMLIAYE